VFSSRGPSNSQSEVSTASENDAASYEGTGGFVKGLVSVLTDIVNAVMSRGVQVSERTTLSTMS
jgi:hypothetical protein